MTRRVFRALFLSALAILFATVLIIGGTVFEHMVAEEEEELHRKAAIAASGYRVGGAAFLSALPEDRDLRYTLIDRDGTVLYDSHTEGISLSHADRAEVVAAQKTGYGTATRHSVTLGRRLRYEAHLLPDGKVLRLATPDTAFPVLLFTVILPALAVVAIAAAVASRLAGRLTEHIVTPLNTDREGHRFPELAPFYRRLEEERATARLRETELLRRRDEFSAVTRHMSEGILLLAANRTVLGINPAAAVLLSDIPHTPGERLTATACEGRLEALLIRAERSGPVEAPFPIGTEALRCRVTPILSDARTVGFVLLFIDVGERERAERMRREFTANVSHELKTPLHSIAGCAELLACGLVKEEDIPSFSRQIHAEASRMIRLVEDILRLSQLDEGGAVQNARQLSLTDTVRTVISHLSPLAEEADVALMTAGEEISLTAIPHLLEEIVTNLVGNAIKYNRRGGSVTVTTKREADVALLTVADTGIGIPEEYRERVFERFFRVDKSRSKKVGGTGLGLSIVKHAAAMHGAKITLESTLGVGTSITVRFPTVSAPETSS